MFTKEQFGERLRLARNRLGKTQTEAARDLGVTSTQISDMEKGRRTTTVERFAQFCEYYNVSADFFLGLTDEERPLK